MGAQEKQAMVTLINRCKGVIQGEIDLLQRWRTQANSSTRRGRCIKRRVRIRQNSLGRIQSLLQKANAISLGAVHSSPSPTHIAIVVPNEKSLAARVGFNVNSLSDPMFTRALDRAERNSSDSVKDAQVILKDCTA